MIKKKPVKKYSKKKAVKKRAVKKISGVHKDNKSHNVKINVLSGTNLKIEDLINKKFKHTGDIQRYIINRADDNDLYVSINNNYQHFANVSKITKSYFLAYNFVVGKKHTYKFEFKKIIILD